MPETRKTYDPEFREEAVRIVRETGKPIAEAAGDPGLHPGTLGSWVNQRGLRLRAPLGHENARAADGA